MVLGLNNIINKDCAVDFYDITSAPGSKAYERGFFGLNEALKSSEKPNLKEKI